LLDDRGCGCCEILFFVLCSLFFVWGFGPESLRSRDFASLKFGVSGFGICCGLGLRFGGLRGCGDGFFWQAGALQARLGCFSQMIADLSARGFSRIF